ncbi:MAG: hypothetical protein N3F05_02160 [Candidatus Diapherotrites archaeon]|nr:hypothetical protein [Candidatus Diapherotrites archaeon]
MQKKKLHLLVFFSLCFFALILSGCFNNTPPKVEPTPTFTQTPFPTQDKNTYYLKYAFDQNHVLFHYLSLDTNLNNENQPLQEMETATFAINAYPDHTHVRMIMLKATSTDKNGTVDICGNIPYKNKVSDVNIYFDGKVDYGWTSATSFYLPQRMLSIGESWTFEGITYKLKGTKQITLKAGTFDVVEIEFSGRKATKDLVLDTKGILYFDYKNNRIAKYVRTESAYGYERKIEQELIGVKKDYNSLDLRCSVAMNNISVVEKYQKAKNYNAYGLLEESQIYALSAKFDLESKDLNDEYALLLSNVLKLIYENYGALGDKNKQHEILFELGTFHLSQYEKEVSRQNINAINYFAAKRTFEQLSNSETPYASEAKQKLSNLDKASFGTMRANIILSDTGDSTGTISAIYDAKKEVYSLVEWNGYVELPLIGNKGTDRIVFYNYRDGYEPAFIARTAEELISKTWKIVLDRAKDESKGIVAGSCIIGSDFARSSLRFEGPETKEIDCNLFYKALLMPGNYSVYANDKLILNSLLVDANKTKIINIEIAG